MEIITPEEMNARVYAVAGDMLASREERLNDTLAAHTVITKEMDARADVLMMGIRTLEEDLAEANQRHRRCHERLDVIIAASLLVAAGWMAKQYPDAPPDEILNSVMEEARIRAEAMEEGEGGEHDLFLFPQADVEGEGDEDLGPDDIRRRGGI